MLRYAVFALVVAVTALAAVAGWLVWSPLIWLSLALLPIVLIGIRDLVQPRHSLLRNYPITGHLRWLFEGLRPEIRQYLIESDVDSVPFSREKRTIVYQRAKNEMDVHPFGTEHDVDAPGFQWFTHATKPRELTDCDFRILVGDEYAAAPYSLSVYNISAMSFGSLGGRAIKALNEGARQGGFAHDTGEGGISVHHLHGGDLIWEIGSGYFGCRARDGRFDADRFADEAARPEVKMIEIKLSQGAKPGHGGMLPAAKITPAIAAARGIPMGEDCISPPHHTAFDDPVGLLEFVARLRELSGGKPTGFKLCIGHAWEFAAVVKAMLTTGLRPDFIVIDGKEGGTGAAPLELLNRMGTPLTDGLIFARNMLIGAGLRPHIRLGASGKLVTAFDLARAMALGADWCNSARGFMFAVGCIQAQTCHTNTCPTGVATQDPWRQRALVVADKAPRAAQFHRNTLKALGTVLGSAGLDHPAALNAHHLFLRSNSGKVERGNETYPEPAPGAFAKDEPQDPFLASAWRMAGPHQWQPVGI